jgi:ABC-type transporter Mla subunit MlaD
MSKYSKRFKKSKKNKTFKKGGANNDEPNKKREGVVDMIGNKISDVTSYFGKKITDNGLKILGLQKINNNDSSTEKVDENIHKISDAASGVISGVENMVDKTESTILNTTNDILGSETAKSMTEEAAEEMANTIKDGTEIFNKALNNPEIKKAVELAIENIGDLSEVAVKAAEKPIDKMVEIAAKETPKIIGSTTAGLMKVGSDMLGAVPYVGAVIDLGKAVNDGSKALSASIEAGSEIVEATSDAVKETTKNIKNELKKLEEKKQLSQQISDRTSDSIKNFENPLNKIYSQQGGNKKTKRKLFRSKKSKRVRFAI